MKKLIIMICAAGFALCAAEYGPLARQAIGQTQTIVRPGDRISDHDARLALARILSYDEANLEGSLAQYRILLAASPLDTQVQVETAQVLSRLKRFDEAGAILRETLEREPENTAILVALGNIYRYTGDTESSIGLYRKVLAKKPRSKEALQGLAFALNQAGRPAESLTILLDLHSRYPDDTAITLELSRSYIANRMYGKARVLLGAMLEAEKDNSGIIILLADIECEMGHARACRDLYLKALGLSGESVPLKLSFAGWMNMWGDFYGAESFYREYLASHPGDPGITLKLAEVLASSQRYEEAENIYMGLASDGRKDPAIFVGLAETKFLEKDFPSSIESAEKALQNDPANADALRIMAGSMTLMGNYDGARKTYEKIPQKKRGGPDTAIEIGKVFIKENRLDKARGLFEQAYLEYPDDIAASFYYNWPKELRSEKFTSSILRSRDACAPELERWAQLYMLHGLYNEAIEMYRAAIKKDPDYFPAFIGLAEALGISRRYDESIALYKELDGQFPKNSRILIGLARILGWSEHYDESIALYREIIRLNPADPVPRREMARTAMWGKTPELSMATYEAVIADPGFGQRVRRSFYLEKEAKWLSFNKRFTRSLPVYETLLNEYPGNEEALFDLAQSQCALGLCDHERTTYKRLLNIDPLHSLAGDALERQRIRSNPSLRFDYSYWNEEGRGDLARITRNRFDLAFDLPMACRYHITLKGHRWLENPDYTGTTYVANGFSLGFSGVFSPFVKGEASWTHKIYDSSDLGTKDTGHGTLWFNIHDRFSVAAGYARTDELYNFFGIEQGIQADRFWAGFHSGITRKFEIDAKAEYINYTDSNSGSFFGLSAGYAFTDHPRVFKIILSGEFRNTRHDNEYIYRNGFLTNIIHPYWAPRDYSAGSVIFEWRHDLSKLFICGSEQHYYDIKASFGTDSENNPYAKLEGEWSYEFKKHWMAGIKGMVHSSPEWNATGAWAHLRYQF